MIRTRDFQPSKSPKLKRTAKRKAPPLKQKHGKYFQRSTYIVTLSPLKGVCFHTGRREGGVPKEVNLRKTFKVVVKNIIPHFLRMNRSKETSSNLLSSQRDYFLIS